MEIVRVHHAGNAPVGITAIREGTRAGTNDAITLTELRDLTPAERENAQSEKHISELEDQWEWARDKLDITTRTGNPAAGCIGDGRDPDASTIVAGPWG